jgi:hypothetical protein
MIPVIQAAVDAWRPRESGRRRSAWSRTHSGHHCAAAIQRVDDGDLRSPRDRDWRSRCVRSDVVAWRAAHARDRDTSRHRGIRAHLDRTIRLRRPRRRAAARVVDLACIRPSIFRRASGRPVGVRAGGGNAARRRVGIGACSHSEGAVDRFTAGNQERMNRARSCATEGPHSARSARVGSIDAARRAGKNVATPDTAIITTHARLSSDV